ncbi:MAG: isocitrate lyase/PEP mutase family protein [Rhizobiales bacterium]|nr:isocitrate lyase/PEP mutase family protein [Hyphomicrobiales bacterium]
MSARPNISAPSAFRALLNSGEFIVSPGVFDGYSARLVEAAGFKSACTSGAAIANAILGVEDLGMMGLSENVNHCRHLARAISIPLTCDADNGYGNPMNVHYTVQMFEEAGVAGVNLEDQVSPKRCGHMPGKEVVSRDEMVKKIEAACLARRDDDFVIIARTDALAVEGLDATLERIRAYVAAGADAIFPDAVKSEEQIARIVEAAGGRPVSVNMGFGIRARPTTPLIPLPRLKELGVRRVSLPRMLPAAAIKAMREALAVMREVMETGVPADRPDLLVGIDDIWTLMGFPAMQALEKQLLTVNQYAVKYNTAYTA